MPGFDGTGPTGQGPRGEGQGAGRGRGCGRAAGGMGFGRGAKQGGGQGFGKGVCQRMTTGEAVTPADELAMLKERATAVQNTLDSINSRIAELDNSK
ncbi:MAG: DUF5320 domain-containing protein [Desulfamplus sp.]|nr:DUF5320 domain-containing protein [Desulfamplus sp.]MBF0390824.1 DUF5320 domain-containing protein [Desulfamplus sp.]